MSSRTPQTPEPESDPRPDIANLTFLERIGRGAHGEVWRASSVTGASCAVKLVYRDRFSSPQPYEREFNGVRLAEPVSREHPALMDVLFVGEMPDGSGFYCVMELADPLPTPAPASLPPAPSENAEPHYRPHTLSAEIRRRGRLSVSETLDLGIRLAEGLHFLHQRGLLHRDIKPANVIFAGGQPKLADIGLVTSRDTAQSLVGTEGYLPPEGPGSIAADLFAFGRLLYEASTGRPAVEYPSVPEDLARWPDREDWLRLNQVLALACAPRKTDRYRDVGALLGALREVQAGRRPRGTLSAVSRRRWLALGTLFGAGGIGIGLAWHRTRRPPMPAFAPGDQRAAVWRGYLPEERDAWAREFIPPRPPNAPPGALDLTPFYNASLVRSRFPGDNDVEAELNSLAALPSGLQTWLGSTFDVRGWIQLDGGEMRRRFGRLAPVRVRNIPIGQRFRRLRVIHDAAWPVPEGTEIARYRIRFSDGTTETVPIRFGQNVHGGWQLMSEPIPALPEAEVVWRGQNPIAKRSGFAVVLYLMTWANPRPEVLAESLELESTMTNSAVGVLAITVE